MICRFLVHLAKVDFGIPENQFLPKSHNINRPKNPQKIPKKHSRSSGVGSIDGTGVVFGTGAGVGFGTGCGVGFGIGGGVGFGTGGGVGLGTGGGVGVGPSQEMGGDAEYVQINYVQFS